MSDAENNTARIKALSFQWGGALFGVADLRSWEGMKSSSSPSSIESPPFFDFHRISPFRFDSGSD